MVPIHRSTCSIHLFFETRNLSYALFLLPTPATDAARRFCWRKLTILDVVRRGVEVLGGSSKEVLTADFKRSG